MFKMIERKKKPSFAFISRRIYLYYLIKKLLKNPEINKKLKFTKRSSWIELTNSQ